ncbi:class I SAM-dependent methyltransferase [Luteibacter pinisoli]|uniref:Class I SAM-dependent methyltransferase n=1 Tax=Luteibacter pinisoli TaxID=2589080 RepID=A0A4Y5Z2K1_9GAMM|nr:class I SAM-dependent methyltransferase [Luteibacter pinisoli]QDE38785.1 class I SAM-dependent methyltransferase [Luteibacter pinisoli]
MTNFTPEEERDLEVIRSFYDQEYYGTDTSSARLPWHCRLAAAALSRVNGGDVLDVACGTGAWLGHFRRMGARGISGIDLSAKAIDAARRVYPGGDFRVGAAEVLPYESGSFDVVTCMGSLEHFVDKPGALREMMRVARPEAEFLLLVPNAGFLTRRLGAYGGTHQVKVKEDVLSLAAWEKLFTSVGLSVIRRRRDLHPLSVRWITHDRWYTWPVRALQAVLLAVWPLQWQYQVYHYVRRQAD